MFSVIGNKTIAQQGYTLFTYSSELFNFNDPSVIADSILVYSAPDTNSPVICTFRFGKQLEILKLMYWDQAIFCQQRRMYQVYLDTSLGYIKSEGVATHTFRYIEYKDTNDFTYYIVRDYSEKYNPNSGGFRIYKYNNMWRVFCDTLDVKGNCGSKIKVGEHYNYGMKNVKKIFYAFHQGEMSSTEDLIIDANGKLSVLFSNVNEYEDGCDGGYDNFNVWIPIKFYYGDKTNILLTRYGDVDQLFEKNLVKIKTYPYPIDLKIPKSELIVQEEIIGNYICSDKGEPILKSEKTTTKYYRWNGKKLLLIK